jgi:threonine/homoserine/homoserine lactone efflux protein
MEHWWLFAVLVFGIIVLPGMDMAFVLGSTMSGGRAAGLVAVGGILLGGVVHVCISALGFGVLLNYFPLAFNVMLIAGCCYVAWIGFSLLRNTQALTEVTQAAPISHRVVFVRALVTCLMNPKAYAFMLAIFPQFIRPQNGPIVVQAGIMTAIIAVNQFLVYGCIVLLAAHMRSYLQNSRSVQLMMSRVIGALLLLTAAWTVWAGWQAQSR